MAGQAFISSRSATFRCNLLSSMAAMQAHPPGAVQQLEIAIFIDKESSDAFQTNRPSWAKENWPDWRTEGIDPALYKEGVPFALSSPGEEQAIRKYARAAKKGNVNNEPPVMLIEGTLPADEVVGHVLRGELNIVAGRPDGPSVLFMKPVNVENYPSSSWLITMLDDKIAAAGMFAAGLRAIGEMEE